MSTAARRGEGPVSVVRFGPWPEGHAANESHLAIAFYANHRLLARHSTLDIAGASDRVARSVSHYMVFRRVLGYRSFEGEKAFAVQKIDGTVLFFALATGRVIGRQAP